MVSQALVGWREKTLEELATLVGGGTPSRANPSYFGGHIDWVTPTDLPPIGQVGVLGEVAEGLTKSGLESSSAKEIPPGSVLFSSRASIGKIAVTDRVCATNQGFANFIPRDGVVDPWFLAYLLCHSTPAITRLAGETTYKEVSRKKLRSFRVHIPRIEEQRRIVGRIQECLERVDEIRRLKVEARIEMTALPSSFLGDIERESNWPLVRIGDLVETRNGRSIRSTGNGGNGYVLTLSAVHDVSLDFSMRKQVEIDAKTALAFQIRRDDVFVSRSNTRDLVGLSAIARSEPEDTTIFPDLLIRLRPIDARVLPRFLAYALRFPTVRDQIKARATGTSQSMVKISGARLREVLIPLPPPDEQDAVLATLDEGMDVNALLIDAFDGVEPAALTQAILRKAFAGEL